MSGDGGVELRHDVLRRHHAFARHVPAALGGGLVLEVDGDTRPRADDVDGVAVTGIKDRAD